MRHGDKVNNLGRTYSHRKALLSNLASSLILHKRITTTVAKAKELRKYVEPLITKSKDDSTHSRRTVFSYLQNKESVKMLFDEVSEKVASRPGGYTRIIKIGSRAGDNAEVCIIELVDYNTLYVKDAVKSKGRTRRGKKGAASVKVSTVEDVTPVKEVKEENSSETESAAE